MEKSKPIGIFDSGLGGLTVVREVIDTLPQESIIYFGDTAHCPYGPRDLNEVKGFAFEIAHFLVKEEVKLLVVACNTATAAALKDLQENFDLPIVGVIEPGARAAVMATKSRRVGVIGTVGTIESAVYPRIIYTLDAGIRVYAQACPELVDCVERGEVEGERVLEVVKSYLTPLKECGVDTLILGCTHYPLLERVISNVMGPEVKIISSAREAAKEVKEMLEMKDLIKKKGKPKYRFISSGERSVFLRLGKMFLGKEITKVEKVDFVTTSR
jgi:glutamate racemase